MRKKPGIAGFRARLRTRHENAPWAEDGLSEIQPGAPPRIKGDPQVLAKGG
jgi:hypothetical protein